MMTNTTQQKIIRGFAILDLAVTFPLAIPKLEMAFIDGIMFLDKTFQLNTPLPIFSGLHLMLANILGVLGVLWAIARIARPIAFLSLADIIGRCYVGSLIFYYVSIGEVTPVLLGLAATEFIGAVGQIYGNYFIKQSTNS